MGSRDGWARSGDGRGDGGALAGRGGAGSEVGGEGRGGRGMASYEGGQARSGAVDSRRRGEDDVDDSRAISKIRSLPQSITNATL